MNIMQCEMRLKQRSLNWINSMQVKKILFTNVFFSWPLCLLNMFMYAMNIQNDVIGLVLRENCKSKQMTDIIAWPSRCHGRIVVIYCWTCSRSKYIWNTTTERKAIINQSNNTDMLTSNACSNFTDSLHLSRP